MTVMGFTVADGKIAEIDAIADRMRNSQELVGQRQQLPERVGRITAAVGADD
jgi:hypothetical protein